MADNEKLGSTSPQVLLRNATNLDKLVNDRESESLPDRFDVLRRTWFGMEKAHDRQMQSQENRFDTFIASSGYEVIGDYTAGPLTLTEYNQLIRYNNELYKLTAATDIPFTTAGNNDETWTGTDAAHFVSVGDAALRQNLGSDEEGMGTWLSTHVQDGVVTQNLHDFLNAAINEITPEMFGGNLQAAFTFASANKLALNLAAKTYVITEPVTFSGGITVFGKGHGKTIIKQLSSADDGVINHTLNSANDAIAYEGFTIQTQKPYSPSNYGIRIDMRAQLSGTEIANRNRYRGYIRDIEIAGSYTRSDGIGFGACIDLISTAWIDLERLRLSGCATAGTQYDMNGVGILQRGDGKPVETRIMSLRAYNFEYAYLCPEYTEGVYLTDSLAVNCKWGVVVSPVSEWVIGTLGQVGCYQFNVDQFHANASMGGVFISSGRYCSVSRCMLILDDHSQTPSVVGVHIRNGYGNTVDGVSGVFYNINGTIGITRQLLIANGVRDSVFNNLFGRTESTVYENITHVARFINAASRNTINRISGINADTGISIAAGCGNNSATGYRFQNVTTAVDDQAGDFNRGNSDSRYVTFTPTAGAVSHTLTITPREYFSRRPTGVSASITSPTTLSFPVDVFYDYANSTQTSIVLIIKPVASGNALPATLFGISINMKD
ncbi:hypothetical protein [Klebsiella oxytoca]|uniref:hypothetical protein n=3 Tax=Klebsiella oxytoca TaxID=571 RepID=UPI001DECE8E7|nr:hypothetical protein [Klebsiella oxytoca]MCY3429324.1 hypothetical protein [Klebsiella oxytoca]MDM4085021.1 hypothetical protein [Klebsiella oxytoca]MDM4102630.1 hypothetical protein [Klebsiella oxytoca]MDM4132249.1 hypothetical protein [Klebsiella oxytoca]MDM4135951.1 hypothetical protein [Klebsiella oxytoca]